MPVMDGMEVLRRCKKIDENLPIVVMTGYAGVEGAVEAIKQGAYDYIVKPFKHAKLMEVVHNALHERRFQKKCEQDDSSSQAQPFVIEEMGYSPAMKNVISSIYRVAKTDFTVLIEGESGVGKDLVARSIHKASQRAKGPYVAIDCGAIPETLLESELFGYEKGAFTNAQRQKQGKFEMAQGGTLFLDEISNMPLVSQAKLLRVIQDKTCYHLGSNKPIKIDVRLVIASNKSLEEVVAAGAFRFDLFYRVNEFSITVPPLRERGEDIIYLARRFIETTSLELNKYVKGFSESARHALFNYSWPGNVRELRAVIRRAVLLANDIIEEEDLAIKPSADNKGVAQTQGVTLPTEEGEKFLSGLSLKEIVRRHTVVLEQQVLTRALKLANGNKAEVARLLQADYKTIHNKLKKLAIVGENHDK
jgi:two-component system nitrogen regulation response regulator GlnG